ncbi:MAG: hypothetical protein C7B44_04580 [Sulfobacillus thermosulfidooxidans]|nr:MAG: hypothetical protein C7B44_04580 [Sulfobacillus thermosulfidooxidans]
MASFNWSFFISSRGTYLDRGFRIRKPKALLWPTVDILVPTYNEDLSILRRTLTGCILQDYPPDRLHIYVCDDGARPAVEHLAEVMGVRYLSRKTRTDAKAGNLNAALAQTTSEFVVIFDADMVPKPKAVKTLVKPVLQNTPCAFSQAPQAFFNHDPFQHNLGLYEALPNEQDFFMRSLQAARAQVNALLFVGSNAAWRRPHFVKRSGAKLKPFGSPRKT